MYGNHLLYHVRILHDCKSKKDTLYPGGRTSCHPDRPDRQRHAGAEDGVTPTAAAAAAQIPSFQIPEWKYAFYSDLQTQKSYPRFPDNSGSCHWWR